MLSCALLHQRHPNGRSRRAPFIIFYPAREELLPAVAMLCREMRTCKILLTSTQHVMQHTDRCMGLTCFGDQPGEMYCLTEAGHVFFLHCMWLVCQVRTRKAPLLRQVLGCQSLGAEVFTWPQLHPACRSLFRDTCTDKPTHCTDSTGRGPHKVVSQWLDCWLAMPVCVWVGSPGFPWENLNLGG